jgi:hypothetical protein
LASRAERNKFHPDIMTEEVNPKAYPLAEQVSPVSDPQINMLIGIFLQ